MNTFGWDTISVVNIDQVNRQLTQRLSELLMTFDTSWDDAFAGKFAAQGNFGPWSITGGDASDIHLTLPITNGTIRPVTPAQGAAVDISGMSVTLEVNLAWVPSAVAPGAHDLCFALNAVTPAGAARQPGDIYFMGASDPHDTGKGRELGTGVANVLLDNKDKITFVFAQTGLIDPNTATWLLPKQSAYSYHTPTGSAQGYLAIFSVTTDRDISQLATNIDSAMTGSNSPLVLAISGDMFMQNAILPGLPATFPGTSPSNFQCAAGQITLAAGFDLPSVTVGAIGYTPTVDTLTIAINSNALRTAASGHCGLHLPNAQMTFSTTTNNVLAFDPVGQTFSFQPDPNPQSSSDSDVPWYDYLIGLGALGAAIIAIVLKAVENAVGETMSGTGLAGKLAAAPASTVRWAGLERVRIQTAELNDCLMLYATIA
ncbi:TULIP family P47-like protein [Massilia sp. YMA4]|uniref:TULIP family P47-like protein n=1 Tax=Massilia sp. YMA4 TaxID=1593482 RepID=UPI000DD17B82|nr:TULIP family P47-like protein [Massilia sp. YMA4]AXA90938.1 hypothetical protein DPH57_07025 [Massilia sp. YMA4]